MSGFSLPKHVVALECTRCHDRTDDPWAYVCAACGNDRREVIFDDEAPARMARALHDQTRPFDMWRYRELLPIADDPAYPLVVGGTPLCEAPRLARALDVRRLWLKDDGRNPSGSLKDRPSSLAAVMCKRAQKERAVAASTGNAASSLACATAALGIPATIFVPKRAPLPKLAQLRVFGAQVLRVDADYDRTWELASAVADARPWYNRNCAINPYLVEGKKTCTLEIAEVLGEAIPDWIVLSVGDGCTIAGAVKGLEQAHQAGLIPRVPRVLGVQAQGARPLVDAFERGGAFVPSPADSVADSISVGHPRNGAKALDAVRRVGGAFIAVDDEEILSAEVETARLSGIFGEPAAAAAAAGVRAARLSGVIEKSATVCVIISGNGLKDTDAALRAAGGPMDVPPNLDAVLAVLRDDDALQDEP